MKKVTVVIPCHNEEGNIKIFFDEVKKLINKKKYNYELIFIDDGSNDNTYLELKKILSETICDINIIKFSRNFGKEAAIYAGLENSTGDYVALIDADMQQDPKLIHEMLKILEKNSEYDSVCCFQEQRKEGKILSFFKNKFYKVINSSCDIEFVQGASDFRLLSREVVDAILSLKEKNRFSKGIFSWVGFNTYYMPYTVNERLSGKTNWSFRKLFRYAINGIESFTSLPLKLVLISGILITFPAFIALIFLVINSINNNHMSFFYIIDLIVLFGGLNLIAIGIVGEYISKIYDESRNRPIYLSNKILNNKEVRYGKNKKNI